MKTLIILQAAPLASGGFSGLLLIGVFIVIILVLIVLLLRKNENAHTKPNASETKHNTSQIWMSILPIMTIIIGVAMYFGSISLEKQGHQLHSDTFWGKVPVENFHTADSMVEMAGYFNKAGIVIGIAGALWLVVAAIGSKKKAE